MPLAGSVHSGNIQGALWKHSGNIQRRTGDGSRRLHKRLVSKPGDRQHMYPRAGWALCAPHLSPPRGPPYPRNTPSPNRARPSARAGVVRASRTATRCKVGRYVRSQQKYGNNYGKIRKNMIQNSIFYRFFFLYFYRIFLRPNTCAKLAAM